MMMILAHMTQYSTVKRTTQSVVLEDAGRRGREDLQDQLLV